MRMEEVMDRLARCNFAFMIAPASPLDLLTFSKELPDSGLSDLPSDYQEFLQCSNGLVLDDAVFFSTDSIISCDSGRNFSALIDSNMAWRRRSRTLKNAMILGVSDDDLFAWDMKGCVYLLVDRVTNRVIDRYSRFPDFLASLIDERRDSVA